MANLGKDANEWSVAERLLFQWSWIIGAGGDRNGHASHCTSHQTPLGAESLIDMSLFLRPGSRLGQPMRWLCTRQQRRRTAAQRRELGRRCHEHAAVLGRRVRTRRIELENEQSCPKHDPEPARNDQGLASHRLTCCAW